MKHILSGILLLLAAPLWAQPSGEKVKPQHVAPPPAVAQYASAKAQTNVTAKSQALAKIVPTLEAVNNKTVSLRWNNPEPINGYFDDFESHPDFAVNSAGSIGC